MATPSRSSWDDDGNKPGLSTWDMPSPARSKRGDYSERNERSVRLDRYVCGSVLIIL